MKRYEQAKKDYEYLVAHHGADCSDLTGGFVFEDKAFELLRNPTKTNAYHLYSSLITHYANAGYEDFCAQGQQPDFEDDEVCNIFRRNCDEQEVMNAWGVDISEEEDYE